MTKTTACGLAVVALAVVLAGCDDGGYQLVDVANLDAEVDAVDLDAVTTEADAVDAEAVEAVADAVAEAGTDLAAAEAVEAVAGDVAEGPTDTVQPAAYVPAKSFRFREATRDAAGFHVDVVARDFDAVFGIALRVEFDPAALDLADVTLVHLFGDDATKAIYKWALVRPGSATLALSHLTATTATDAPLTGDVTVATLTLVPKSGGPASLSFYAPRSLVLQSDFSKVDSTFIGATVYP